MVSQSLGYPPVVGVSGLIGSGKDEVAKVLIEEFGYIRIGFADALKREVQELLPRTLAVLADFNYDGTPLQSSERIARALREKPRGVRELLQEWGSELRRAEDPDYWVVRWEDAVKYVPLVVVPDCRFPNELQAIQRMGGVHWRVVRPGTSSQDHISEHALDGEPVNMTLYNDESLKALRECVRTMLRKERR